MATALAVAIPTVSALPAKDGTFAVPILATPVAGPIQSPLVATPPPLPVPSPSPYQNRGEGGIPFPINSGGEKLPTVGIFQPTVAPFRPLIFYAPPPNIGTTGGIPTPSGPPISYPAPTDAPIYNPNTPVPAQPPKPLPPGTKVVMPVPAGQQPVKAPVKPVTLPVPVPKGPVSGTLFGYDLSQIPALGWVAIAAGLVLLLRR